MFSQLSPGKRRGAAAGEVTFEIDIAEIGVFVIATEMAVIRQGVLPKRFSQIVFTFGEPVRLSRA